MSETLTFTQGTKKREELQLPIIHFVAADDWIDKLGTDAFCAWLKFYSWCDRSNERKDTVNDVIPTSFEKIIKRLGTSKPTFYKKILPALWNYGLIDIVEYEHSASNGRKPKNVIVYEYPQNKIALLTKPLDKIRDFDTEYTSEARTFAKQGGRRKGTVSPSESTVAKIKTNMRLDGKNILPGVVKKFNQGGKNILPNNVSKVFNDSNSITNDSNKDLSIYEDIDNSDLPDAIKKVLFKNQKRLIDLSIDIDDVVMNYKSNAEKINEYAYATSLKYLIDTQKDKIRSYDNLMNTLVTKRLEYDKDRQQGHKLPSKEHKKTSSPEWLQKEKEKEEMKEKQKAASLEEKDPNSSFDPVQAKEDFKKRIRNLNKITDDPTSAYES